MQQCKWKQTAFLLGWAVIMMVGCPTGVKQDISNGVAVFVEVFDSIGGTLIKHPSFLTVYEAGTGTPIISNLQIIGGKAQLMLLDGKKYDFKLAGQKNRLAASVLENYQIRTNGSHTVTMIQRMPQIGAKTEAPSIKSIMLNNQPFEDGCECSTNNQTVLEVVFHAPSRAIQPAPKHGNFGCAFAVGSSASSLNNVITATPVCVPNSDDSWTCTAQFQLDKISFLNEVDDFVITVYDLAGNRFERRINDVIFNERNPARYVLDQAVVQKFRVEMHRYPQSIRTYSVSDMSEWAPVNLNRYRYSGSSNSYQTQVWFYIKDRTATKDVPIRGFDIYRREAGQTEWFLASRKKYNGDSTGLRSNDPSLSKLNGVHLGYDADLSLKEGVIYEYKVSIYGDSSSHIESNIATVCLLPPCSILLDRPADNGTVKATEVSNLSFSFKLTDPDLWTRGLADFFSFGLLLTERTSDEAILFAGKITVALKKPENKRLSLQVVDGRQKKMLTLDELKRLNRIPESITEQDILTYENGIITIKPFYLFTQIFNHPKYPVPAFKVGHTYCWDILDWGEDPVSALDNEPAVFAAVWNSKTKDGMPLKNELLNTSESFANVLRSGASLNGQFFFKVIDK